MNTMDIMDALEREPLDQSSDIPLYMQLKERIMQVMATRALDDQTPLPTEQEISSKLGLSRGTVRRCFRDLVDEGRVVRRRGLGTFAAHSRGARGMDIAFSFTAEVTALGMKPSSEVLGLKKIASRANVSRRLRIPDETDVWEIRRIRRADGDPMQYVVAYVPCDVCPELSKSDLESSLYALIVDASGCKPAKAVEVYEAVNLDAREAKALGVPAGTAALRTLRTTYDSGGRPFETSVIVSRADRNRLQVTLDSGGASFSKVTS